MNQANISDIVEEDSSSKLAIIGMAIKLPDCETLEAFWQTIQTGHCPISDLDDAQLIQNGAAPDLIHDPQFVKRAFIIDDIDHFDIDLFSLTPREASMMDPQFRLILETAWHALENAGIAPDRITNPAGIFTATGTSSYLLFNHLANIKNGNHGELLQSITLTEPDFIGAWLAYFLDITGPVMGIRTACSSSLVALSQASQSLLNWQCDLAIVSASSVAVPQGIGYRYQQGSILSSDGYCRPFDHQANGTLNGNGGATIIMKRLEDAQRDGDPINAVILGSAINNDGRSRMGFLAPGNQGQEKVIQAALAEAEVSADSISYIETHGTGTSIGDPIEFSVLNSIYGSVTTQQQCALGSLKANYGHLNAAAGLAGLIKTVLCLKNQIVPPIANLYKPNPALSLDNSRLELPTQSSNWDNGGFPRRAAVSSFGFGGTNVHVILEEAVATNSGTSETGRDGSPKVLKISAASDNAFQALCQKYYRYFEELPAHEFVENINTLNAGRADLPFRALVNASCQQTLLNELNTAIAKQCQPAGKIIYAFSGQGHLVKGCAAKAIKESPFFLSKLEEMDRLFQSFSFDIPLLAFLRGTTDKVGPLVHQPALFALQYALTESLRAVGYYPDYIIGHSIGEIIGAYYAGIFSLETAARIVFFRAKAMNSLSEKGQMIAVVSDHKTVIKHLEQAAIPLDVSAINSPNQTVLSGSEQSCSAFINTCKDNNIKYYLLNTDAAFHSRLMGSAATEFIKNIPDFANHTPAVPMMSTITASWVDELTMQRDYWSRQITEPVIFMDAMQAIPTDNETLCIEIGLGSVLSNLISAIIPDAKVQAGFSDELFDFLQAPYIQGAPVRWQSPMTSCSAPEYSFDRQRYWMEPPNTALSTAETSALSCDGELPVRGQSLDAVNIGMASDIPEPEEDMYTDLQELVMESWSAVLGSIQLEANSDFFELGGNSIAAIQIVDQLKNTCEVELGLSDFLQLRTVANISRYIYKQIIADVDQQIV